jgi:hypothetical protein
LIITNVWVVHTVYYTITVLRDVRPCTSEAIKSETPVNIWTYERRYHIHHCFFYQESVPRGILSSGIGRRALLQDWVLFVAFHPEDGRSTIPWTVDKLVLDYTTSHTKR